MLSQNTASLVLIGMSMALILTPPVGIGKQYQMPKSVTEKAEEMKVKVEVEMREKMMVRVVMNQ